MKKRYSAMLMALVLLVCMLFGAGSALAADATTPDIASFYFVYAGGTSAASLNGLIAPVSVPLGSTVPFSSANIPVHNFGYQIVSISPSSHAATASTTNIQVRVEVRQIYGWYGLPGYPTLGGYPGYPNNGTFYNGSWYPSPAYNNPAWNMPDATYTWNGQTYVIPGWMVYDWITQGSPTPWPSGSSASLPTVSQPVSQLPSTAKPTTPSAKSNLYVGQQLQLTSSMLGGVDPNNRYIYFRSNDTRIITVTDNGLLTGINAGTTRISAFDPNGRVYGTWEVSVGSQPQVSSITLSTTKKTMQRNAEFKLTAYSKGVPINVSWISSNPSIGTVDSNGWVTTYESKGKITVTAFVNGGPSRSCTITVK